MDDDVSYLNHLPPSCKSRKGCDSNAAPDCDGYCFTHFEAKKNQKRKNNRQYKLKKKEELETAVEDAKEAKQVAKTAVQMSETKTAVKEHAVLQVREEREIDRKKDCERTIIETKTPDGTVVTETHERTHEETHESIKTFKEKVTDRDIAQIKQEANLVFENQLLRAADNKMSQFVSPAARSLYLENLRKKQEIAGDAELRVDNLHIYLDKKHSQIILGQYYDLGQMGVLINHMLFQHLPHDQLPQLTCVNPGSPPPGKLESPKDIVSTNWVIPCPKNISDQMGYLTLNTVQVPLSSLLAYCQESPVIKRRVKEHVDAEANCDVDDYKRELLEQSMFMMAVKGTVHLDENSSSDEDEGPRRKRRRY